MNVNLNLKLTTASYRIIASGLAFPEGPISLPDGSILIAEIAAGRVSRYHPDFGISLVVKTGGGPNGLAIGPDGALYICNNGGLKYDKGPLSVGPADDYRGGSIQRFDFKTGSHTTIYDSFEGQRLSSPNDIIFDSTGGFYFSDIGKRFPHSRHHGGIYYATVGERYIRRVVYPHLSPNGLALSSDGRFLYVSDTESARIISYEIERPGHIKTNTNNSFFGGDLLFSLPHIGKFDSMALDASGSIVIGTLGAGVITVVSGDGKNAYQINVDDKYPTNICFSCSSQKKAYITAAEKGILIEMDWPCSGQELHFSR